MPNVLTEKLGPLPLWGWLGIATAGVLLVASKGKKSSSTDNSAAAQQQLAAEEAALANSAQTATPATNSSSSTYGSGGGRYGGNGNTGSAAPVYSATPAASTTTPVVTSSSGGSSSSSAPVDMSTAPAPVASATNYEYIIPYTTSSGLQMEDAVGGPNQAQAQSEAQTYLSQLQSQGYTASVNPVVITQ